MLDMNKVIGLTAISQKGYNVYFSHSAIAVDFELQPSDTVARIDSSVLLDCRPPMSNPPANISWSKSFAQISDARYVHSQCKYVCLAQSRPNTIIHDLAYS